MEVLGIAANLVGVVELSAKIASLCLDYSLAVKDAKKDISRLHTKVKELEEVAKDVQQLINGPRGGKLSTSQKLEQAVLDCHAHIKSVNERLDPGKRRKAMSRFGLRALKWPFESSEVDKIIRELENCNTTISLALHVDQTRLILDISQQMVLEKIPSAPGATFDSFTDELNTRCHPDTRVDLLHQIKKWAKDPQGKCIFWLSGMAGTGKSTISRTIAHSFANDGQLGASFFFKRGEGERGKATMFFTTIAAQLISKIPELIPHIRSTIDESLDISAKPLREQFEKLIFQPLLQLHPAPISPLVLVIDALDECDGDQSIREILHLLAKMRELTTIHMRVFLTSRPELAIRLGFNNMSANAHEDMVLQDIPPATIEQDISAFLKAEFAKIKSDYNLVCSPEALLSSDWPGDDSIRALTTMAVPLFIFAATICRFIGDRWKWNPNKRLNDVLEYRTSGQSTQLDQTYLPVLKQLEVGRSESQIEELSQEFTKIIGSIVVLADPLPTSMLANLLGTSKEDVDSSLHYLHSVLSIPSDPNSPVRLLHLSFREFLIDHKKEKSGFWFWVDEKKTHSMITTRCLERLSTCLKENICSLGYPGILRRDISTEDIDRYIPADIQYSCRYWVHHLEQSGRKIFNGDAVDIFLHEHFLHWLEVLSLLGKTSDCISLIDTLRSLADENKGFEVSSLLYDARRFILQSRWIIDHAPLQLYSSALIFTPEKSVVRATFLNHIPKWICRLPKTQKDWNAELQKLEGHSNSVRAVSFSSDSKQLASGSYDRTVRLWDAATGEQVKKLEGHSNWVNAVAFSSDSKQLASASDDRTVRLWDPATGEQVKKLEGHSASVNAISFSPDGKLLASASDDETVRLWSVTTGEQMEILKGHSSWVYALAFSSDSKQLVSTSRDWTVRLWDLAKGEQVKKLEGHSDSVKAAAFSPDGKQLASASIDRTIRLWDATTGEQVKKLEGHNGWVLSIAFSPNGKQLASASDDTVRLWDPATGEQVKKLEGHSGWIRAIAFSPNGKLLASASDDRTVRLWDATTEERVDQLEGGGKQLALAADDTIKLSDPSAREQVEKLEGHGASVIAVALSPDGKQLASASKDWTIRLWDTVTGKHVKKLEEHSGWVMAITFSPDGKQLALASDEVIRLLDVATGGQMMVLEGHSDLVMTVAFYPDGKHLESTSIDKVTKLWDVSTGEEVKRSEMQTTFSNLRFSGDNKRSETNEGIITIPPSSTSLLPLSQNLSDHIYNLSGEWITRGGQNLLWLPHDYRGECSALRGGLLVIGRASGGVSIFGFEQ